MPKPKKRHPGVSLIKPNHERRQGWRARYRDPDSGKTKWKTVPAYAKTKEAREDWAVRLSQRLMQRQEELDRGATRATNTPLADAIQRYYAAHPRLRPRTIAAYRASTDKLIAFAERAGVKTTDDLNRRVLMSLRDEIVNEPRQRQVAGGKRGARVRTTEPRSAYSINRDLRGCRTVLGYLADADLLARCTQDDLRRCFKLEKTPHAKKRPLKSPQLKKLLQAALRHDADTFKATRAELRGHRDMGSTPKHTPIAGFTLYVLLTGCRVGEALRVTWRDIDLDEGTIHVGTESKTSIARDVDIAVTPALRRLLAAQRLRTGGRGLVWGLTVDEAAKALQRLKAEYGAPASAGWQMLRVSCQSFLASSPSIYGSASLYLTAERGGHSIEVCRKHYANAVRNIDPDARTIEAAMGIEQEVASVVASLRARRAA